MIPGLTYGVWLFFALDPVEVTVFGLSAYTIRGLLMMDVVRHTHLGMSYGRWLNQVFLCPHYHQLHHSVDPRHYRATCKITLTACFSASTCVNFARRLHPFRGMMELQNDQIPTQIPTQITRMQAMSLKAILSTYWLRIQGELLPW